MLRVHLEFHWNLMSFKGKIQMKICKAIIQVRRWAHLNFLRIGLCRSRRWDRWLNQVMIKKSTAFRAKWARFKNATCQKWSRVRARLLVKKREEHLGRTWSFKNRRASNCWKKYRHRTKRLKSVRNSIWRLKLTHMKIWSRSSCTISLSILEMIARCISNSWNSIKSQQPTSKTNRRTCTAGHPTITY